MITIKKLKTLKTTTMLRKILILLEIEIQSKKVEEFSNTHYYKQLMQLLIKSDTDKRIIKAASRIEVDLNKEIKDNRTLYSLKCSIEDKIGIPQADWDFNLTNKKSSELQNRLPMKLFLDDIRSPFNVGSIFRSSDAFGVSEIILSEDCPPPTHPRSKRSSMGTSENILYQTISFDEKINFLKKMAETRQIFALELGGTKLSEFKFPEKGIAVIGSEELGITPEILKIADESGGRVSIPMCGNKASLNVSVATGILLSRWSEYLLANSNKKKV